MKKHPSFLPCLLAAAAVLTLAGCAPAATEVMEQPTTPPEVEQPTAAPPPTEEEAGPTVLRVGSLEDLQCWNPFSCGGGIWDIGYIVYEGLTDHGPIPGCSAVPRLADTWEVSDDGKTWTITLHKGITFSDGTAVTAQTVVDFFNWFGSTEMKYGYPETNYAESIEAVDELTLKWTTSEPILNSPDYDWQWLVVLPPHIWGELDDSTMYTFEAFPPIGTGAYTVTEHEQGSHIIFDARPDYYRGKPPIDRVVYQIYANTDALVNALLAAEIDVTDPNMPPDTFEVLKSDPGITVEEKAPGVVHELVFNMYKGEAIESANKHPAIDDPLVREAIDYAIDKEQLVEVALLGHGITCPTNWSCGPNYKGELNPNLAVTPFDLEKARQILDEAGYKDSDVDGIRETPSGLPLNFRLFYFIEDPADLTMSQQIEAWLQEIGIKVAVEAMERGTWWQTVVDARDFDMAIFSDDKDLDAASMDFWYGCWAADAGGAAFNHPGYCNEEMDKLVYEYWLSDDLEGRWEPMFKAQELFNKDRPIINLAGQNSIQAYRTERFEFPLNTCDVSLGMVSPQGLLNAVVK